MACSGLKVAESRNFKARDKNCTQKIVDLALSMLKCANKTVLNNHGPIVLKIGIHYGPVIAGVIGYHKPQFSLIGDTVNTTSRVCSTGEDGIITLSEEAYQNLNGVYLRLHFNERKVQAKGKGEIKTYQIEIKNVNQTILSPIKLKNKKNSNIIQNFDKSILISNKIDGKISLNRLKTCALTFAKPL